MLTHFPWIELDEYLTHSSCDPRNRQTKFLSSDRGNSFRANVSPPPPPLSSEKSAFEGHRNRLPVSLGHTAVELDSEITRSVSAPFKIVDQLNLVSSGRAETMDSL